jgi:hypothetical protein
MRVGEGIVGSTVPYVLISPRIYPKIHCPDAENKYEGEKEKGPYLIRGKKEVFAMTTTSADQRSPTASRATIGRLACLIPRRCHTCHHGHLHSSRVELTDLIKSITDVS